VACSVSPQAAKISLRIRRGHDNAANPPYLTRAMKSLITKHTVKIAGRQSSISLEDEFWHALQDVAKARHQTLSQLVNSINADRNHPNLASAVRLYVLEYYKQGMKR